MTTFFAKRIGSALFPDGADSTEAMAKLKAGAVVKVEAKQPRNPRYHRWFFAICKRIADGVGSDAETIANVFKHATGHVTIVKTKSYGDVAIPNSISFAAMDDTAFHDFVERCISCAYQEWGIDPADLADLLTPMEGQKTK